AWNSKRACGPVLLGLGPEPRRLSGSTRLNPLAPPFLFGSVCRWCCGPSAIATIDPSWKESASLLSLQSSQWELGLRPASEFLLLHIPLTHSMYHFLTSHNRGMPNSACPSF